MLSASAPQSQPLRQGVSPLWVFACIEAGKLLPAVHPLYRPLAVQALANARSQKEEASISSFGGAERTLAGALILCTGKCTQPSLPTKLGPRRVRRVRIVAQLLCV